MGKKKGGKRMSKKQVTAALMNFCLLYTSDAADESLPV